MTNQETPQEAKDIVAQLGDGWGYNTRNYGDWVVFNLDHDIYIYSQDCYKKFTARYKEVQAKGDSPAGALRNLSAKLSSAAQQIDVFAHRAVI